VKIGVGWLYVQIGCGGLVALRTIDSFGSLPTGLLLTPPAPPLGMPILPKKAWPAGWSK
jgi:hypothetical protein